VIGTLTHFSLEVQVHEKVKIDDGKLATLRTPQILPRRPSRTFNGSLHNKTMSVRANPLADQSIVSHVIHRRLGEREDSPSQEVCQIDLRH
jgi:hypothetical protein